MEKEQWTSQFPLLEMHLVEWVDRTNHKHIIINDFVAKTCGGTVKHPEDYTDIKL